MDDFEVFDAQLEEYLRWAREYTRLPQQFRQELAPYSLTGRTRRNPTIQNIPAASPTLRSNFFGVDRSAQSDRLRGARYTASWVDQVQAVESSEAAFARQWLDDYGRPLPPPPAPRSQTEVLAKQGLAKLDAEEAELAKRTARLGVHDPEPVASRNAFWSMNAVGRFNDCSCDECAGGRAWNSWADRNGIPADRQTSDPRIRQGVISAE